VKLIFLPLALAIIGVALVALNFTAPRMVNENWETSVRHGDSHSYFSEFERNRSAESRRFDIGLGLTSLGASLLALMAVTRTWTVARLRKLQTPVRRWAIVLAANLAWFYYILATWLYLVLQFQRHEFPPWADSMAIPLVGLSRFAIAGGIVVNVGLLLCLLKAKLPASLWSAPRSWRAWSATAGVTFAVVMCVWAGIDAVLLGDPFTPPAVIAVISLLLVGRACASAA